MKLPSDEFLQQMADLKDREGFTGVLQVHCHQGIPKRVDVPGQVATWTLSTSCKPDPDRASSEP